MKLENLLPPATRSVTSWVGPWVMSHPVTVLEERKSHLCEIRAQYMYCSHREVYIYIYRFANFSFQSYDYASCIWEKLQ